jgi:SecD/SecF fusion protein
LIKHFLLFRREISEQQKEDFVMEKQKRWHLFLIIAVIALTIYNILPTVFYYSKPLREPINASKAQEISASIADRVNALEDYSQEWVKALCKNLSLKPKDIHLSDEDPSLIEVSFSSASEAETFRTFLPRSGELIPFVPAQLRLSGKKPQDLDNTVLVERNIPLHFSPESTKDSFIFSFKHTEDGSITNFYRDLIFDRVISVSSHLCEKTEDTASLEELFSSSHSKDNYDIVVSLSKKVVEFSSLFGEDSPMTKRYYESFMKGLFTSLDSPVDHFDSLLSKTRKHLSEQYNAAKDSDNEEARSSLFSLQRDINAVAAASKVINAQESIFKNYPLYSFSSGKFKKTLENLPSLTSLHQIDLERCNPFVKEISIDWETDTMVFELYDDIKDILEGTPQTEIETQRKERLQQYVLNEVARVSRLSKETIRPAHDGFELQFNTLTNSKSFLALDLGIVSENIASHLYQKIASQWTPEHRDLSSDVFPVVDYSRYSDLLSRQQRLCLLVFSPLMHPSLSPTHEEHSNAIYVVARGLNSLKQQYDKYPDSEEAQAFNKEFENLAKTLYQEGFIGYPGSLRGINPAFKNDFIFELNDYYGHLLQATRESFAVHGTKRYAVLEFTDHEQRLLTLNEIDKKVHEDIIKWRDERSSAQVDLNKTKSNFIPPPTKSLLWENLKLNVKKYFRGDERKIIKWGLDLSGGKMVRIALFDQNNRPVTDSEDIKQGVNELTRRVNKMGLSEVSIRMEGKNIALDFPGSQGFSATDLVKASSMYFHVVNEKFSGNNKELALAVDNFLQDIWNEAVVTNRTDIQSVNEIAWYHLEGSSEGQSRARSEHAQLLYENGLRLSSPKDTQRESIVDDTLSTIAVFRSDTPSEWQNQKYPLLIVFNNYVMEGADLESVNSSYDPEKGNILNFGVKSSYSKKNKVGSPREDLFDWTSLFSQEKIAGTVKEEYSRSSGWRMAVILNGYVISAPTLNHPLRTGGSIYGKFSQREINKLVADLKAGSLSFSPRILSEKNISPELGKEERNKGISSAAIGLFFVVAIMVLYYRFGGVVASIAVIFNLLIMWGVLQNLDAALTLAGIAGIILTVGMAVDANVLVFERIREEFAITQRLAPAIQAGYKKAFSAIIDSNVTTIIAALILMQFDSGPIKGFAITLIIGIASSMFTALFMTRYFFMSWVRNPAHKILKMSNIIGKSSFNFLSKFKVAGTISLIVIAIGGFSLVQHRMTMFGMDFSGGYSLSVQVDEQKEGEYRSRISEVFFNKGASDGEFQIRELNRPNHLLIQCGMSMEEEGHPFYNMPIELTEGSFSYDFEKNPRITWVVETLKEAGMSIDEERLEDLDQEWSTISGQFSDVMRKNAIIGLSIAMLSILIYITFRFEFKYAISALIGLIHDVGISMSMLGLLHVCGVPIQINMPTIAAIMTIIGYSLNDTIIIFDRIREDVRIMRKKPFAEIVNIALNTTLSRTLMTSVTTLSVLIALVLFGGSIIFDFVIVMTVGVIFGTLSSLFIVPPIMLYFHNKEEGQKSHK